MRVLKKRKIKLKFKLILLAAFLAYTGFAIYSQQLNINNLQQEQKALTEQYAQAETDFSRLKHQNEYRNTEKYVEDAAREKFGLTYSGEIILETGE